MRTLSIRQPWAWLILNAGKDIENREWRTSYRGPILVHAGKGMTRRRAKCGKRIMAMVDVLALVKMFCEKHTEQRLEFQPWMTDEQTPTLRIDVRPCPMCLAEHWADAVADR